MHQPTSLLAVPNISEGREQATIDVVAHAFTDGAKARLLDVHSDADHHRAVFTLTGIQGRLSGGLLAGAGAAVERIDVSEARDKADVGRHPHVGAVDVMPLVYLDFAHRGAACAEALVVAHEIGKGLGVPVFLYGELAQGRTRADLRRGGVAGLAEKLRNGDLRPDFGPMKLHPTAGATLVAAREPLVAFNLELSAPAKLEDAKRIASLIREGGPEGFQGVRAIGVPLRRGVRRDRQDGVKSRTSMSRARRCATDCEEVVAQVSMNIERPLELPLRAVVQAVQAHAPIACAELVGLAPKAAFEGFPEDVPLIDFDPKVHLIENALGF